MSKLVDILFALIVPGLIVSQTYKTFVEKSVLKDSSLNTVLAVVLTAIISLSGAVISIIGWESVWCLAFSCEMKDKKVLEENKNHDSINQSGTINQYNMGSGSNNAEVK